MAKGKVRHAARSLVIFEGVTIGVLSNITLDEDYNLVGVKGIGDFADQEEVATGFTGTFNYSSFILSNDKIKNLQYAERAGKSAQAIARAIMTQEGFTLVLQDKIGQDNIATVSGCKMGHLTINASQGQILGRSGSGKYLDLMDTP